MTHTHPTPDNPLKIGTRASPLALAQAHETRARLMAAHDLPEAAFQIVPIKTTGDDRAMIAADRPLKEIGNKGLFTKEIEEAMLDCRIDIAVHSMKDMPTLQPDGLVLGCYLPREASADAFVSRKYQSLADLPAGAVVGTSSLRRKAQVLNFRSDLTVVEFRGNVQTRLAKLDSGVADCTFLAMAGLNRLGMTDIATAPIAPEQMLPAIAQGAIGIEWRSADQATTDLLAPLHDTDTACRLAAERAFLAALDGSCETPIAGLALLDGDEIWLRGEILRPNGQERLTAEGRAPRAQAAELGRKLAHDLRNRAPDDFFSWM